MVLKLRQASPDNRWSRAKCLSVDILKDDPFFSEDPVDQEEAVHFCNGTVDGTMCPIRDACLNFALVNNEEYGVWGGMSALSRRAVRRKYPAYYGKPNEE